MENNGGFPQNLQESHGHLKYTPRILTSEPPPKKKDVGFPKPTNLLLLPQGSIFGIRFCCLLSSEDNQNAMVPLALTFALLALASATEYPLPPPELSEKCLCAEHEGDGWSSEQTLDLETKSVSTC